MREKKRILPAIVLLAALTFGNWAGEHKVYAQEPLPLEELNIQEDPLGLEDGEGLCDENKEKEEESEEVVFRCQRYLSSGVSSTVYEATVVQGVDVSKYQGNINWAQVKASGIDFAMIRVGYRGCETGAICADPYFEQNIQNALAAGVKVGIYFFSQAITEQEAYEEASYTIQMIKKYNITYPVAFDWETSSGYRTYNANVTGSKMTAIASKFCDTVASAGYIPIVYSNTTDFNGRYEFSTISSKYYIWYARYLPEYGGTVWYKNGNRLPNYDNNIKFNIWQYMSDGTVPGISGNCDVNVSFLNFGTYRTKEVTLASSVASVVIDNTNHYISGLAEGATYLKLASSFSGFSVTVNGNSISSNSSAVLKTGDKLVFTSTTAYTYLKDGNYTYLLSGDVNGDGSISVLDMEAIQKHVLSVASLTSVYYAAADVTGDSVVSVLDMEAIQRKLLGLD